MRRGTKAEPLPGKSVAALYPHLVTQVDRSSVPASFDLKQWRPTSNALVAWICPECGHRWEAPIIRRAAASRGQGCRPCRDRSYAIPKPGRSVADLHKHLIDELDLERVTDGLTLHDYREKSNKVLPWRCPDCDHRWEAPICNRTKGHGCRECAKPVIGASRSTPKAGRSAAVLFKDLIDELDPDSDQQVDLAALKPSSGKIIDWRCLVCGHRWPSRLSTRAKGHGCAPCGSLVTGAKNAIPKPGRSLAELHSELSETVSRLLNPDFDPSAVASHSSSTLFAACLDCDETFSMEVRELVRGRRHCNACRTTAGSIVERQLREQMSVLYPVDAAGRVPKTAARGRQNWYVDVLSPLGFIVEYDGSYWHGPKAPERRTGKPDPLVVDTRKSEVLRGQGYTLVRVREAPLDKLHEHDLVVPFGATVAEFLPGLVDRLTELGHPPLASAGMAKRNA